MRKRCSLFARVDVDTSAWEAGDPVSYHLGRFDLVGAIPSVLPGLDPLFYRSHFLSHSCPFLDHAWSIGADGGCDSAVTNALTISPRSPLTPRLLPFQSTYKHVFNEHRY